MKSKFFGVHGFVGIILGATLPFVAQAENQLKPGLWEYQMTMEMAGMPNMPGMPGMGGAPMTFKRCLTPEDARSPERAMQEEKANQNCKREDFKQSGNRYTFTVRCTGPSAGTGSGDFTMAEDHFEGTMMMKMTEGHMDGVEMKQKMSGKRIGDCKK